MPAVYDTIAAEFKKSWQHPYRLYVESFTMFGLIGNVSGKAVLDLACGEGTYTRALKRHGAARVVGVDISQGMIDLARQEEARLPLGVEYRVADATRLDPGEEFDLVTAAYLLNHARTAAELQAMCAGIARALKPGGRFVGVNNNLDQRPESYENMRKYGYVKSVAGPLREGTPITLTMFMGAETIQFDDYYLSRQTYEEAFRAAGLKDLHWHLPQLSPEGAKELGADYWKEFFADPPNIFLECVRE